MMAAADLFLVAMGGNTVAEAGSNKAQIWVSKSGFQ